MRVVLWVLKLTAAVAVLLLGGLAGMNRHPQYWPIGEPEDSLATQRAVIRAALEDTSSDAARLSENARALALAAPTDPLPYEARLVLSLNDSSSDHAPRDWAMAAFKRDRRSRAARTFFFLDAVDRKDWDGALDAYIALGRVRASQGSAAFDIILAQLVDPVARNAVLARIASENPPWGRELARRLDLSVMELSVALEFYRPYPELHAQLLGRLMAGKRYSEAYLAYILLRSENEAASVWPVDGEFAGSPSPAPFNWTINNRFGELLPEGGLYVSYGGSGRPRIASQLLPLTPGAYRFETTAIGEIADAAGDVLWSMTCVDSSKPILSVSFSRQLSGEGHSGSEFTVPEEGCSFQLLSLVGQPGEYSRPLRLTIGSVSISQVRRSE